LKIRIYYEDTDAGGITYHANYIKFCERARSEYLFSKNIMPGDGSTYGFVVRHMEVDYYAVSVLGDLLDVKSSILSVNNTSMQLLQEIFKNGTKLFRMKLTLVYVESCIAKNIPEEFREIFRDIQDKSQKNLSS
jgi:acyl-CoA thioester hydrolase